MTQKKVYLVTGASGFIGSCLARKLVAENAEVHVFLKKDARTWRIDDILNKMSAHVSDLSDLNELNKLVTKINPTVIYHLATYGAYSSQKDADRCIQTNIQGTWHLLQATMGMDYELFVNTGSSSEYGFKKTPMKETDSLEPASYYAATKASQTLLCSHIARAEKKPIVTLRPFSVYGPYEEPARFVPTLMKALYFKEKMNLVSPAISRDHIYVDDMVNAFLLVDRLKEFPGETFNIGTGHQSSIKDVVETSVRVTGETTDFNWGAMSARAWDTTLWVADTSKAKQLLGWSPQTDLGRGLSQTWEWFKKNHFLYTEKKSGF